MPAFVRGAIENRGKVARPGWRICERGAGVQFLPHASITRSKASNPFSGIASVLPSLKIVPRPG